MSTYIDSHIAQRPPEILYHYTNQAGLLGILSSWEIWTTKIQFLNDTSEFNLALKLATNELKSRQSLSIASDQKQLISFYLEAILTIQHLNICVASFSENGDVLSQWRGYGSPSSSFAIGFSGKHLARVAKEHNCTLAKCVYDRDTQQTLMKEFVESFLSNPLHRPLHGEDGDFIGQLVRLAPLLKNEFFSEESEWRLVTGIVSAEDSQYALRQGRSLLVPYYRVSLTSEGNKRVVPNVILGPCPHMDLAKDSVDMLSYATNVDIKKVQYSKIPYRSW